MSATPGNAVTISHLRRTDMASVGTGPEPCVLKRDDGTALLYHGLNDVHGPAGAGKTLLADYAIAQELCAGQNAVIIDNEDSGALHRERLQGYGVPLEIIEDPDRLAHFTVDGPLRPPYEVKQLERLFETMRPHITIIDAWGGALTNDGYEENSNSDVLRWREGFAKPLLEYPNVIWAIDHISRGKERSPGARGAGAKLQAITGASYELVPSRSFSRTRAGMMKLVIAKDRGGHVGAPGTTAALIDIVPRDNGAHIDVTVRPPDTTNATDEDGGRDGEFRPTHLMERASITLERMTEANDLPSRSSLADIVVGKREFVIKAIDCLLREGYAEKCSGPKIRSVKPYREQETTQ
jgi:hypothetical protein